MTMNDNKVIRFIMEFVFSVVQPFLILAPFVMLPFIISFMFSLHMWQSGMKGYEFMLFGGLTATVYCAFRAFQAWLRWLDIVGARW